MFSFCMIVLHLYRALNCYVVFSEWSGHQWPELDEHDKLDLLSNSVCHENKHWGTASQGAFVTDIEARTRDGKVIADWSAGLRHFVRLALLVDVTRAHEENAIFSLPSVERGSGRSLIGDSQRGEDSSV